MINNNGNSISTIAVLLSVCIPIRKSLH